MRLSVDIFDHAFESSLSINDSVVVQMINSGLSIDTYLRAVMRGTGGA